MTMVTSMQSELKFFWTVVSIIIYGLKIFGLTPFSVQNKRSGRNSSRNCARAFVFSRMGLAYNVSLSVVLPVMVGFQFPRLLSLTYKYQSSVVQITDPAQAILCVFTVWIVILTWTFNQRKAVCILNKMLEIDVKLSYINKQSCNKMNFTIFTTHVIIHTFLWVVIWITESVQPVIPSTFLNSLFYVVPSFVIYWFIVEYFMVVGLVAEKFEIVNKNLSILKGFRNYLSSRSSFLDDYLTGWSLATHRQLDAINLLHNIRAALFDLSQDIAEFFSFPILACITYCFVSLVTNVYFLITLVILENEEPPLAGTSRVVAYIFMTIHPLALLSFIVTKTVKEAKLTGRLVHKLWSLAAKEEMKTQLKLFSLQLLHENINFTAYGFFKLDFTLLNSMLGATATFLVILIQFR